MNQEDINCQIEKIDAQIEVLNRKIKWADRVLWVLYTFLAVWLGLGAYWFLTGKFT